MGLPGRTLAWVVVAAAMASCTGGPDPEPAARRTPSAAARATAPASTAPSACHVTVPTPAAIPGQDASVLFGAERAYGNGRLWVGGLGEDGVIRAGRHFVTRDGGVEWKLGWWREVPGRLEISGRRIDAPAPPVRSRVPAGYGRTGFQSSGVLFPTEGCWRLTGRVGSTALTFVVSVTAPSAR